jgi:hypothetical protein
VASIAKNSPKLVTRRIGLGCIESNRIHPPYLRAILRTNPSPRRNFPVVSAKLKNCSAVCGWRKTRNRTSSGVRVKSGGMTCVGCCNSQLRTLDPMVVGCASLEQGEKVVAYNLQPLVTGVVLRPQGTPRRAN